MIAVLLAAAGIGLGVLGYGAIRFIRGMNKLR